MAAATQCLAIIEAVRDHQQKMERIFSDPDDGTPCPGLLDSYSSQTKSQKFVELQSSV